MILHTIQHCAVSKYIRRRIWLKIQAYIHPKNRNYLIKP
nr:MAG TPA: hypothetical protein [Caudoviricetes sp.]